MKIDTDISGFRTALETQLRSAFSMKDFPVTDELNNAAVLLRDRVYSQWEWNYGNSPPFTLRKKRWVENCGVIEILIDVGHGAIIRNVTFYGDFFGYGEIRELENFMSGLRLEYNAVITALEKIDISRYIHALTNDVFVSILFD